MFTIQCKRRYAPDDKFFEEGNIVCRMLRDPTITGCERGCVTLDHDEDETSARIQCQISGCFQEFASIVTYEAHYFSKHKNVCQTCGRVLPTNHLLEIHINEQHNPMFEFQAKKVPMYACLVYGCSHKFKSSKSRRNHLIKDHKYPSSFRFDRSNKTKTSQRMASTQQTCAMEVESEVATPPKSTSEQQSRFNYSYRVPPSISFGQGVPKSFMRRRPRSRGNHLTSVKAVTSGVDIQSVDMTELSRALDTT